MSVGRSTQPFNRTRSMCRVSGLVQPWLLLLRWVATNLLSEYITYLTIASVASTTSQKFNSTQSNNSANPASEGRDTLGCYHHLQIKRLWRTCNLVLEGKGHAREQTDMFRPLLLLGRACRKIETCLQKNWGLLLCRQFVYMCLFQSCLLLLIWQPPSFLASTSAISWMLVLQTTQVTSSISFTRALWFSTLLASIRDWAWRMTVATAWA